MNKQNESVWDVLIDDTDETDDLKKRSDYMILVQARLNGQSGTLKDKADRFGLNARLSKKLQR